MTFKEAENVKNANIFLIGNTFIGQPIDELLVLPIYSFYQQEVLKEYREFFTTDNSIKKYINEPMEVFYILKKESISPSSPLLIGNIRNLSRYFDIKL